MARYRGPVCRLCRREGEKLFLKGERCFTNKCAVERREGVSPGQHGKSGSRQAYSDFKAQLREKQKVKRSYRLLEKPFRAVFDRAVKEKGVTGTQLLVGLESRLDNVAYRLGFGISRGHARQVVLHGHVRVNGKCVTIPSYLVSVGDVIEVAEGSRKDVSINAAMTSAESRVIPEWLMLEREVYRGTVKSMPTREQLPQNFKEQFIVELYSK